MSFLGVKNPDEQRINTQNRQLLAENIPFQYQKEFLQSIGLNKLHEREITMDEINLFISQHPAISQAKETAQITQEKQENKALYTDYDTEQTIKQDIEQNMKNLANHESGTSWMKWGAMFGGSGADQITAAGFKAIIEQNKILIRQNELIRRQNEKIIELLSKED